MRWRLGHKRTGDLLRMIRQNAGGANKYHCTPVTLIIGTVFAVAIVIGISASIAGGLRTIDAAAVEVAAPNTERVVIAIEGMHCTACASGIKSMLKRTPGVVSAEVSFENKEAVVEFRPADTSREKILEVITNMGYKANVKG